MVKEIKSQEFNLGNRDETINYFIEETNQNELISKKHTKKDLKSLNYIDHLLILTSAVTWCVSISALASLVCIPIGIVSSSGELFFYNKKSFYTIPCRN